MNRNLFALALISTLGVTVLPGCGKDNDSKKTASPAASNDQQNLRQDILGDWTMANLEEPLEGLYTGVSGKEIRFEFVPLFRFNRGTFAHIIRCNYSVDGVTQTLEAVTERTIADEGHVFNVTEGGSKTTVATINGEILSCGTSELKTGSYTLYFHR
ncbi:MAG TPA: hypothetical protein VE954_28920 [Oligoflexus sp.]|uniref:hypothetical protein n=1 Tax=Oligoflexus sp. TaxID=1971216 RepID=UPI002D618DEF|nr:hypothetical protein [Oligoflexus sp.]HYX37144.1 hypothetical protein [Oligoflexus sp.]